MRREKIELGVRSRRRSPSEKCTPPCPRGHRCSKIQHPSAPAISSPNLPRSCTFVGSLRRVTRRADRLQVRLVIRAAFRFRHNMIDVPCSGDATDLSTRLAQAVVAFENSSTQPYPLGAITSGMTRAAVRISLPPRRLFGVLRAVAWHWNQTTAANVPALRRSLTGHDNHLRTNAQPRGSESREPSAENKKPARREPSGR